MEKTKIILVSSEGLQVEFREQILDFSDFIQGKKQKAIPNPHIPIQLNQIGIDHESLVLIRQVFQTSDYKSPSIPKKIDDKELKEILPYEIVQIFQRMPAEVLTKLNLSCYKLGLSKLSDICCIYIAYLFKDYQADELSAELQLDIQEAQKAQVWILQQDPWINDDKKVILLTDPFEFEVVTSTLNIKQNLKLTID